MVCVPCILLPFLLFVWHKLLQPIVLKFWNPWKPVEEKTAMTDHGSESGENENNINKCLLGNLRATSTPVEDKKEI